MLLAIAVASPVTAQTNPAVPTRQQIEPFNPNRQPPAQRPQVDNRAAQATAPCPLADSKVMVTISGVDFVGPDTVAQEGSPAAPRPLAPAIAELLADVGPSGTGEQSIAAVCEIRDRASARLAKAGYIASVQIPAQEIADGRLKLVVVTARLVEVRVRGDIGRFRGVIEDRVAAIKALDPLNQREAERLLLLAGDVPGLTLRLALRPAGGAPGDVIGDLTVETQDFSLVANLQNSGSRQLGREVLSVRGEAYGLTGLADRTFLAFSNTLQWKETHVIQAGHDMGLGDGGFRIGGRASFALSDPDIQDLDLRTKSLVAGLDVSMPLLRAINFNLRAAGGFEILNQRTIVRQEEDTPFTRDRLRVLFARLETNGRVINDSGNEIWRVDGYVEVRKGLDILNATKLGESEDGYTPSRFDGDPQATIIRGEIQQTLRPWPMLSLGASAFGQWSNEPLLNFEEFSIGNLTYGRGYDPGSNGADRVIAARAEPRVQVFGNEKVSVEIMGFFDFVRLWNLDRGTQETERNLKSAGGGIRVALPGFAVLDVTYAKPLDLALSTDEQRPPARVLVSLTTKLIPWGLR